MYESWVWTCSARSRGPDEGERSNSPPGTRHVAIGSSFAEICFFGPAMRPTLWRLHFLLYLSFLLLFSVRSCGLYAVEWMYAYERSLQATLARISAVIASQKEKKPAPEKKTRGKKKAAAASA